MADNINLQQVSKLLDEKLAPIQKTLNNHGKLLESLKKDQNTMLNLLDREQMDQRKRLERVEKHLEHTHPTL